MSVETKEQRIKRIRRESMARARKANPVRTREQREAWYNRNRDRVLANSKQRYAIHGKRAQRASTEGHKTPKEKQSAYNKQYAEKNRERIKERRKERDAKNRPEIRRRKAERYANDAIYWIATRLRGRMNDALKLRRIRKTNRTMELIGCTTADLRRHLERQFQPGMTWANRGDHGWHIDHILPCESFDLSDPAQQRQCFHWTNLRPLWAVDNRSKGAKIPHGHQPQLAL